MGVEVGRPSCRSRFEQQEQGTEAERLGHMEEVSNRLSQQKSYRINIYASSLTRSPR
jgi:hypothetical protein